MNTRIKELIKQAEETYTYKDFDGDGFEEIKQSKTVNQEKFAELIINECAIVADRAVRENYAWPSYQIRKHFGVK